MFGDRGGIGEPLAQPITIITKTIHNLTNFTTLWKTPNDTFWHRSMHFGRGMRRDPIAPDLPPGPPPKTQVFFFYKKILFICFCSVPQHLYAVTYFQMNISENWCKNGHKNKNYSEKKNISKIRNILGSTVWNPYNRIPVFVYLYLCTCVFVYLPCGTGGPCEIRMNRIALCLTHAGLTGLSGSWDGSPQWYGKGNTIQ